MVIQLTKPEQYRLPPSLPTAAPPLLSAAPLAHHPIWPELCRWHSSFLALPSKREALAGDLRINADGTPLWKAVSEADWGSAPS